MPKQFVILPDGSKVYFTFQEVFRDWKANKISMQEGAGELHKLGMSVEMAWDTLQRI